MRAIVLLPCLVVLATACASSHEPPATRPNHAPSLRALPLSATLDELRAQRSRLKSAAGPRPVDPPPTVDVRVLVGIGRDRIQGALGPPESCDQPTCADARSWYYEFYYLPEGWIGGGTALFLTFDGSGRCAHASWGGFK